MILSSLHRDIDHLLVDLRTCRPATPKARAYLADALRLAHELETAVEAARIADDTTNGAGWWPGKPTA